MDISVDSKLVIAIVAALLAIAGNVPYLIDIVRERIKPHPYTWFVWSLVSGIVFFGQVAKGAGVGAIPTAAAEIFTFIIFLLSLKYGFKDIRASDTFFLILALLGVGLWVYTNDPTASIVIAVLIDVIAFVPTLRKTWKYPTTETPILYSTNVLRHVLALFALQSYNLATTLHSVVMIGINSSMVAIIIYRRYRGTAEPIAK